MFILKGMGMGGMGKSSGGGAGSRGGIFGFGQSTARIIKENTGVTFKLVATFLKSNINDSIIKF